MISYLETHLVDHCNLNCKGCSHFCSLVKEPVYKDVEQFREEINQISNLTNQDIRVIRLMGGEPMLHPLINKFCEYTRNAFPHSYIEVVTNGLIFAQNPQPNEFIDDFIKTVNKYDITVDISIYPPIKAFPSYISSIKRLRGEPRMFFNNISLDLEGKQDTNYAFENCANQAIVDTYFQKDLNIDSKVRCVFLKDGYIYPCAIVACINYFENEFNKKLVDSIDNNRINIFENNIEQIEKFLSNPIPFCKYCRPDMQKTSCTIWGQSQKNIDEWTSTIKFIGE